MEQSERRCSIPSASTRCARDGKPWSPAVHSPKPLQRALQLGRTEATQTIITVLPRRASGDVATLQQTDPATQEVLVFWRRKQRLNQEKWKQVSRLALALLRQRDGLVERSGVSYRRVFHPDGAEPAFQLLLPAALKEEVPTQLHQEHGPGLGKDILMRRESVH